MTEVSEAKSYRSKIEAYFFENIIKCLMAAITVAGFLVFWVYYTQVQYMPQIDLLSSMTLIVFAALTGTGLVTLALLLFMLPGYYWRLYVNGGGKLPEKLAALSKFSNEEEEKSNARTFFSLMILPFITWSFAITGVLILTSDDGTLTYALLLFLMAAIFLILSIARLRKFVTPKFETFWSSAFGYFMSSGLSTFVAIIPLMVVAMTAQEWMKESDEVAYLSLLTVWGCIAAIMLIVSFQKANMSLVKNGLIAAGITLYLLSTYSEFPSNLPRNIMKSYKLGNLSDVTLIVDAKACKQLGKTISNTHHQEEGCRVDGMNIVSRLGAEHLLEDPNTKKRYTINSDSVYHMIEDSVEEDKDSRSTDDDNGSSGS